MQEPKVQTIIDVKILGNIVNPQVKNLNETICHTFAFRTPRGTFLNVTYFSDNAEEQFISGQLISAVGTIKVNEVNGKTFTNVVLRAYENVSITTQGE